MVRDISIVVCGNNNNDKFSIIHVDMKYNVRYNKTNEEVIGTK